MNQKIYRVQPTTLITNRVIIEGEHQWMLPGIDCPICSAWAPVGEEYPCIIPSKNQLAAFKPIPQAIEWYAHEYPRFGLRKPDGSPAKPGTKFGPINGTVDSGSVTTDFFWVGYSTLLVLPSFYEQAVAHGLRLSGAATLTVKKKGRPWMQLLELQIETGLSIDPSSMIRRAPDCSVCGRSPLTMNEAKIKLSDGQANLDLFRGNNRATMIFATEAFKKICEEQNATNIGFTPLQ